MLGLSIGVMVTRPATSPLAFYAAVGIAPGIAADFVEDRFLAKTVSCFDGLFSYNAPGLATYTDQAGSLVWNAHNLLLQSQDFSLAPWIYNGNVSVSTNAALAPDGTMTASRVAIPPIPVGPSDMLYQSTGTADGQIKAIWARTVSGTGEVALLGHNSVPAALVTLTEQWQRFELPVDQSEVGSGNFYAVDFRAGTLKEVYVWGAHLYRADLGGMANNPDSTLGAGGAAYVPTASAPVYKARRNAYAKGAPAGMLFESEARRNLLLNSRIVASQTTSVTTEPHTLSFYGTGTVTLSGASTAGPLNGTGVDDRVALTFTPAAGTLILTVSGSVIMGQLEAGTTASSYIPTEDSPVTRAAETIAIPAASLPAAMPTAFCISLKGRAGYADSDAASELGFYQYRLDGDNLISAELSAADSNTGQLRVLQKAAGTSSTAAGTALGYAPGVTAAFRISSRHGASFTAAASNGDVYTGAPAPAALPELVGADLELAPQFMGYLEEVLIWFEDIGDAGLSEATS